MNPPQKVDAWAVLKNKNKKNKNKNKIKMI